MDGQNNMEISTACRYDAEEPTILQVYCNMCHMVHVQCALVGCAATLDGAATHMFGVQSQMMHVHCAIISCAVLQPYTGLQRTCFEYNAGHLSDQICINAASKGCCTACA